MSFFRFNKEIDTKDLKLSDYDQIWTKFCFLDETGSLNDTKDPFFTVGIIKTSQPYYLLKKIHYERQKNNFYDELKFNKLSKNNVNFAKNLLNIFFNTRSLYFYSYSVEKEGDYFKREFASNPWSAYQQLTVRLVKATLSPKEVLILLADHVTTPKNVRFEVDVKRQMNSDLGRLVLAGVCRLDSKSNDLLQIVDLFIGAISYDLKIAAGSIKKGDQYKKELLNFLKARLGVGGFTSGFRNKNFNIFVDKDIKKRLS